MLDSNAIYWIWLQEAVKYASRKPKEILEIYGDAEKFYCSGEREWRLSGIFTNKEINNLNITKIESAQKILEDCKKIGCRVVGLGDEDYPYLLKQIDNPPAVLYVFGDLRCLNDKIAIAVVGTRKASQYGLDMTKKICEGLAKNGAVVVSGGAMGIDCAAHETAVKSGGRTVCVLGCGLDFPYLSGKNALKREIVLTGGAVISEYPPGTPAHSFHFPIRNRIISGLSHGTVVIESGEKSGSLITANLANDQNRDVYVVPPVQEMPTSLGSMSLIRDGAQVITSAEEIICEYPRNRIKHQRHAFRSVNVSKKAYEFVPTIVDVQPRTKCESAEKNNLLETKLKGLGDLERLVYNIICEGKIHIDKIVYRTGKPSFKLLSILTKLEIMGLIRALPGRYYEVI